MSDSAVYLSDYQPYGRALNSVELEFDLYTDAHTLVHATLRFGDGEGELELDGEGLQTQSIHFDDGDALLEGRDYRIEGTHLRLLNPPNAEFTLRTKVAIDPYSNTRLEGLYCTNSLFCTQCEAEGFRRITWYPDRPDVLSRFRVKISAPQAACPVLLSNGNLVGQGDEGDRHWALWEDPHPKPAYLFALVAGDLGWIEREFTTASRRAVQLRIYAQQRHLKRLDYAMQALIKAMVWDEEHYGREYDLDCFNVVAVDDFNMGAMENKGLNVFNTACLVADASVQTDQAFQNIEAVVAHEYFHNWSGNRITCRDWFQLSLKEGFTVFRENSFVASVRVPDIERIATVRLLRSAQFPEDGSPTAHPVQPQSYEEISNFYTATVYEKGAEVIRMLRELMGVDAFRKGCDEYFRRYDGQAVCIEDFLDAMAPYAAGVDLEHFRRWYVQSGTPQIEVDEQYDPDSCTYRLTLRQQTPITTTQPSPEPLLIPVRMALLIEGDSGQSEHLPLFCESIANGERELVLQLNRAEQSWTFERVEQPPLLSLLRGFSAPVKLLYSQSADTLVQRVGLDSDLFSRWDALQQLGVLVVGEPDSYTHALIDAMRSEIQASINGGTGCAVMLTLPDVAQLVELQSQAHPSDIARSRFSVFKNLAEILGADLRELWERTRNGHLDNCVYAPDPQQVQWRAEANHCLGLLCCTEDPVWLEHAERQVQRRDNMTDITAGFNALLLTPQGTERARALLEQLRTDYADEPLVLDTWLRLQASSEYLGTLGRVRELQEDERLQGDNPNAVRALIGSFSQNPYHFHSGDGSGYQYFADYIYRLDGVNPQLAARLGQSLVRYRKLVPVLQQGMRAALESLKMRGDLSSDLSEVVGKGLRN